MCTQPLRGIFCYSRVCVDELPWSLRPCQSPDTSRGQICSWRKFEKCRWTAKILKLDTPQETSSDIIDICCLCLCLLRSMIQCHDRILAKVRHSCYPLKRLLVLAGVRMRSKRRRFLFGVSRHVCSSWHGLLCRPGVVISVKQHGSGTAINPKPLD